MTSTNKCPKRNRLLRDCSLATSFKVFKTLVSSIPVEKDVLELKMKSKFVEDHSIRKTVDI